VRHRLYFNVATGLLVRMVAIRETPAGVVPQQTDFDQWRDAGGAMFPFKVRTSLVDPWVGSTRLYSTVTLDAKLDKDAFTKPK